MSAWSRPQPSEGKTLTLPAGDDISSTGRVWRLAAVVPCAVIFCSMALLQWQDYASSPVFTSYESRYLEEVVFPGVTVCMWPPFNPKRLEDIGVKYNFSHHCVRVYNGIYYKLKCEWMQVYEELLWELPGAAWDQDLDQVWEEAAWRPSDLFISYKFAGQTYQVKDSDAHDTPLQPTLSALNRCFTFTPAHRLVRPHLLHSPA
ncbi:uncharacterized protein LOC121874575 isoform X2 [Homarus americanus]|uniref:uncharacterized protein LOC121874575 isoform X2 n=1 Tax=Homarus americanus TaxID=6706 RepID=UPI001C468C26|nr:uncharacterized protein LOC121874575 isoform X2 [Homarus americanus]